MGTTAHRNDRALRGRSGRAAASHAIWRQLIALCSRLWATKLSLLARQLADRVAIQCRSAGILVVLTAALKDARFPSHAGQCCPASFDLLDDVPIDNRETPGDLPE
jgi:hypothetical protein